MRIQADVPLRLADITPAWLTDALKSAGLITATRVIELDLKVIGEETGFLGLVAIVTPRYEQSEPQAPASLILKIPTALKNRVLGQSLGVYEKEIRFYRDLQPLLKIATPRHFYSALNAFDEPHAVLRRLNWLNRLPLAGVAIAAVVLTAVIAFFPRRYVLLIENLSHFRMGDQLNGCSDDDIRRVLETMAELHGQFWNSESLTDLPWIVPVEQTAKLAQLTYMQAVERYKAAYKAQLSARHVALLDWLKVHGLELTEIQGTCSRTLLHGDFRLDNLCFDDTNNRVIVIDWQTMTIGSAGLDLAYFLSAALPLDATEEDINQHLKTYRHGLEARGVRVSQARLRWQYEIGMLSMLHRVAPVMFQAHLDIGTDRGPALMQDWIAKTFSKLEAVEFEHILSQQPDP
ncbi:MAG: phosphotransferase [Proteobacteria bacterium]|nr:phosphotransferase [Pseudomonadota bacterium]